MGVGGLSLVQDGSVPVVVCGLCAPVWCSAGGFLLWGVFFFFICSLSGIISFWRIFFFLEDGKYEKENISFKRSCFTDLFISVL